MKLLNLTLRSNQAVCVNVEQITHIYPNISSKGNDGTNICMSNQVVIAVNEPFEDIVNLFTQLTTGKEARSTNVSRKS